MAVYSTLAAVDLGSNSFHLQVARVVGDQLYPLDSLREPLRFGAGLNREKRLDEDAQSRALECMRRFGERLRGRLTGACTCARIASRIGARAIIPQDVAVVPEFMDKTTRRHIVFRLQYCIMAKLINTTNRFLKDPVLRKRMVLKSVASSSAIEGIRAPFKTVTAKNGLAQGASRKKKAA